MLSMQLAHCRSAVFRDLEKNKELGEQLGFWKGSYLVGMIPGVYARSCRNFPAEFLGAITEIGILQECRGQGV